MKTRITRSYRLITGLGSVLVATILLAMLASVAACGGGGAYSSGNSSASSNSSTGPTALAAVAALFINSGANWNDYVVGDAASASDIACNAASDTACLHGGERRVVVATGKSSCNGLTVSDALGAFTWVCDATTSPVRLISTGLADGKNLSDLINFNTPGFRSNQVTVYDNGSVWGVTASTIWWSNPVVVNNNGGSLAINSTIYVVTGNPSATYTLDADRVGLVIQPGVTLSGSGTNGSVISSGKYFVWLEGAINAMGDLNGAYIYATRFCVFRNVTAVNASGAGVFLQNVSDSRIAKITAKNSYYGMLLESVMRNALSQITASSDGTGIYLFSGSKNILLGVVANNNSSTGVVISGSGNTVSNVTASNNAAYGVGLNDAYDNTLSAVMTNSNGAGGVYLLGFNSSSNTLSSVTANNSASFGVALDTGSGNTLSGMAVSNNSIGVFLNGTLSSNNTLSDLAAANNSSYGVVIQNLSNSTFTGLLRVGNNAIADCFVNGGTNQGLVSSTCANNGTSDATLTRSITLASSFVGKISGDDTQNASDVLGAFNFPTDPTSFDWTHFDNAYRNWGIDGSVFPNADQQGQWTIGIGRIWDWSLSMNDSVLRNVLALPNGNDTLTHVWSGTPSTFNNTGCDALVGGSVWNGSVCVTTFLRHAIEILGDRLGNDNTLCESNETCLYTPNIGSYQGHGNLVNAGVFTNGRLSGITLMKYATNGR